MKIAIISYDTREYISMQELSPGEQPAGNAVNLPEPVVEAGKAAVANAAGDAWEIVPDYRQQKAYSVADGTTVTVETIGALPATLTATVPPDSTGFNKFDGSDWVPNTAKKQQAFELAESLINKQTNAAILTGFNHSGYSFILSPTNQFNHKAEFDIRDQLVYPYKIKHADGYLELQDADEYAAFYLAGLAYIRTQLVTGWGRKDALTEMTTAQLITFINDNQ